MADKENFPVHIIAVDGFTKVLQGIRNKMGGFSDSFAKAGKAMTALKRDSGWTAFTGELSSAKDNVLAMANSIANVLTPLGAVTGGLGLASVRSFSNEFAVYSRNVDLAAKRSTFLVDQIQAITAGAKLAGMDTHNLTDEIIGFDQKVRGAVYKDTNSLGLFNSMGISLLSGQGKAGGKGYIRPGMDVLKDIADYYKHQLEAGNGQGAENIIQGLGMGSWVPLLAGGRQGINRTENIQSTYGFHETAQEKMKGVDLFISEQKAATAWDNLTKSIGAGAAPAFTKLNEEIALWMKNEATSRELGNMVGESFLSLSANVTAVAEGFEQAGEKMGIWKNSADMIIKVVEFSMVAAFAKLGLSLAGFMANFLKASLLFSASPLGFAIMSAGTAYTMFKTGEENSPKMKSYMNEHGASYIVGDSILTGFKELLVKSPLNPVNFGEDIVKLFSGNDYSSKDILGDKTSDKDNRIDLHVHNLPAGATVTAKSNSKNVNAGAKVVTDTTGHH